VFFVLTVVLSAASAFALAAAALSARLIVKSSSLTFLLIFDFAAAGETPSREVTEPLPRGDFVASALDRRGCAYRVQCNQNRNLRAGLAARHHHAFSGITLGHLLASLSKECAVYP